MYREIISESLGVLSLMEGQINCLISLAEKMMELRRMSPNRNLYSANYLDYVNASEPHTSWIIAQILKYQDESGHYPIALSFIDRFLKDDCKFDISLVRQPKITWEKGHLDVCIKEPNKYAVVIENKLKGAVYQRNQLARYIKKLLENGYSEDQIFLVIIPGIESEKNYIRDHIRKSAWRCPSDWWKPNQTRRCAHVDQYLCWCDDPEKKLTENESAHCQQCTKDRYLESIGANRTSVISSDFTVWLTSLIGHDSNVVPRAEWPLASLIGHFADYLNIIYSTRENHKLTQEMKEFLNKELLSDTSLTLLDRIEILSGKIDSVDYLQKQLNELRDDLYGELIDKWRIEISEHYKIQEYAKNKSFDIQLKNDVFLGCWIDGDNEKPYWEFHTKDWKIPNKRQISMVNQIIENCGQTVDCNDGNQKDGWVTWGRSLDSGAVCMSMLVAANELDLLK